jgi:ATP-dependent helicase/nuclease subunit B
MTLRLWLGPAGSGKTFRCLAALRACERDGRHALLLVPEQFTYAADRLLLEDTDLPGARFVRVMSFRRLAHLAAARGTPPRTLTDEGRRFLLRRAVHEIAPEALGPLAPVRQTPGFVDALAHAVQEAKGIAGPEAAARLAAAAGGNAKTAAVARLVAAYDDALHAAGLDDPSESVHAIAENLRRDPGTWAGVSVWVDGFVSFTPEERVLLLALARIAGELTITLAADPDDARLALARAAEHARHGIFPASSEFIQRLRPRLRRPLFLGALRTLLWIDASFEGPRQIESLPENGGRPERFAGAEDLARLERDLFCADPPDPPRATAGAPLAVALRRFPTPYQEVVGWARWIDARARLAPDPCRYREITVLVRDLELYRPLVPEVFARYGIPVYIDQRRDATAHPLVRLCLAALRVAQGWTRDAVIGLLRNPLLRLPAERIDRIENLSLEYGIEHERWHETDWRIAPLPPRETLAEAAEAAADGSEGAAEADEPDADPVADPGRTSDVRRADIRRAARERAALEARDVAQRFFPALRRFTETWRAGEPAYGVALDALTRLLRELAGVEGAKNETPWPAIAAWASSLPPDAPGAWPETESAQVARVLETTLSTGLALMPDVPVGAGLMTRLLKDALGQAAIGSTPQALDAVTIAEPRRARVNEAECVILGGLVANAFPRAHDSDPLFSDDERERLAGAGFPLAAQAAAQAEVEPYLLYVAVTRARRALFVTHPALDERGGSTEASSYLGEIARALGVPIDALASGPAEPAGGLAACRHPCELGASAAAQLRPLETEAAHRLAAETQRTIPAAAETLARAEERAARLRAPASPNLPPEIVAALHPNRTLITSASGLVDFAQCPFRYFARHVLRLEPRPDPVLTPLSTGTAVHAALERFIAAARLPAPDEAARHMRQIFSELEGEEEFRVFRQDPPSSHRWDVTTRNLARFAETERQRLEGNVFQPVAVELGFTPEVDASAAERARHGLLRGAPAGRIVLPALEFALEPETGDAGAARWIIRLRGRIDRLDLRHPEGEATGPPLGLVIDYKGRAPRGSLRTLLRRGGDLQIATYLLVVRDVLGIPPAGGVYYSVSPRPHGPDEAVPPTNRLQFMMRGFVTAAARDAVDREKAFELKADVPGDDLNRLLDEARAKMRDLAAGIVRGEIRPDPRAARGRFPCETCDQRGVCRFDDRRLGTGGAG